MQTLPVNLPAIRSAIAAASSRSGVDFDYLLQTARLESGFNPGARAKTSSAAGLFQFIESTWLDMVRRHGGGAGIGWAAEALGGGRIDPEMRKAVLALRHDPDVAARLAGALTAENGAKLRAATGTDPGPTELYLAHFLGAGAASRFINALQANPEQAASSLFPAAAKSNAGLFAGRSVAELYQYFAGRFESRTARPVVAGAASMSTNARLAYLTLAALGG